MNRHILLVAGALLFVRTTGVAMELTMPTIKIGSVTYTNVVITGVNPADIYFHHNGGMANVKLRQLDPTIQKKLNYDPDRAAAAEQERVESNDRYVQEASQKFVAHIEQEREAMAATNNEVPFSLADPLTEKSLLNRPAPKLEVSKWLGDSPPALTGKFALIYFWNSGSDACRQAIPPLNDMGQKYADKLNFITVTAETADQLKPLDTPLVCFAGSDPAGAYAAALDVTTVPTVVLLDAQGVARFIGHPAALTDDALQKIMARYPIE